MSTANLNFEICGDHWRRLLKLAKRHNAIRLSIQDCYTFCDFEAVSNAEEFLRDCMALGLVNSHEPVNRNRPFKVAEVAIPHEGYKYK